MALERFLKKYEVKLEDVLAEIDFSLAEANQWFVIQYPDEWLYVLSKHVQKAISELLYELLEMENAGVVRKVSSEYGLKRAFESGMTYIFIPQSYRKEGSRFLVDILLEKKIYSFEQFPFARYNRAGQEIYTEFLSKTEKSQEFKEIEQALSNYFVLVHDASGSLLCHSDFKQTLK